MITFLTIPYGTNLDSMNTVGQDFFQMDVIFSLKLNHKNINL